MANGELRYAMRVSDLIAGMLFVKALAFPKAPVCFFHSYLFSTTSPLCFPVCSALFFGANHVFSVTSPLCFLK